MPALVTASDYEWIRLIVALLAMLGTVLFFLKYRRGKNPIWLVPITWLVNAGAFAIFKYITDGSPEFYEATIIWTTALLIHGVCLLCSGAVIFKDAY